MRCGLAFPVVTVGSLDAAVVGLAGELVATLTGTVGCGLVATLTGAVACTRSGGVTETRPGEGGLERGAAAGCAGSDAATVACWVGEVLAA